MSDDLNNFAAMEANIDRNLAETEEYLRNLEVEEEQAGPFEPPSPLNQPTQSSTKSPAPRIRIQSPSTTQTPSTARTPPMTNWRVVPSPPPPKGNTGTRSNLRQTNVQTTRPQPTQRTTLAAPRYQAQQAITVAGRRLVVSATKSEVTDGTTAFYKRENRDTLTEDKLNNLFVKASAQGQKKYDFINLQINDPKLLEDTYNLELAIDKTRSNHVKFDMNDVFNIINPNDGYSIIDLYKNNSTVTEQEVAASNAWYQT